MKRIKVVLACLGLGSTLIMTGCSGCAGEPQTSSIVAETSELPSQTEIIETSEEPSEELSEVVVDEVTEMPELILRDENGKIYEPDEITVDQVYAAIDRLVEENDLDEYDRDTAIAVMLIINGPYMSKETFLAIKEDYLNNYTDASMVSAYINHIPNRAKLVDENYYIIDEKQSEIVANIKKYIKSSNYSREDYYTPSLTVKKP